MKFVIVRDCGYCWKIRASATCIVLGVTPQIHPPL